MTPPPVEPASTPASHRRRHPPLVVALLWIASALLILAIGVLIAGNLFLHRAGPMLKAKVIETLSTRFDSRVELAQFHVLFTGGFQVSGAGLKLYPNHLDGNEPMITVDHFAFRILDWRQLLRTPIIVNRVRVSGLTIHLPPKEERAGLPPLSSGQASGKVDLFVRLIDVDRADLVIENGKPGKLPVDFLIRRLRLQSVGAGRPLRFHATLVNPKPIGDIDSAGNFGPFNAGDPGGTPVDGVYSFSHADLNTIKGIGGMLASTGSYQGQLNHIVIDGKTTTPNFSLDRAHRPVPLNTTFHAIVDGTNGDTYLQPVDAWLLHTHIVARGKILHVPGAAGRDIRLDVSVAPGRIDDILLLVVNDQPPIMTGQIQLHTQFDLPPGPASVPDKLRLQGSFTLTGIHFTSDAIQSRVDELSLRGQGKAKEANQEGKAMKDQEKNASSGVSSTAADPGPTQPTAAANVASRMSGDFTFAGGKITLPALNYRVPGADIALHGVYSLDDQSLDFTGQARLDAHISRMVTGWKSLLLKPVDPFFAKDGAGTLVPIRVGGTTAHPDLGLNFHHKDKSRKLANAPPQATGH